VWQLGTCLKEHLPGRKNHEKTLIRMGQGDANQEQLNEKLPIHRGVQAELGVNQKETRGGLCPHLEKRLLRRAITSQGTKRGEGKKRGVGSKRKVAPMTAQKRGGGLGKKIIEVLLAAGKVTKKKRRLGPQSVAETKSKEEWWKGRRRGGREPDFRRKRIPMQRAKWEIVNVQKPMAWVGKKEAVA